MTSSARPPLAELARRTWDVLVIGGGITGAAVFREAAGLGMRVLLIERDDYASGTSSHSAKLVHGGLHYLSRFQLGLARESIRERDLLLQERAGLVEPIDFILPVAEGDRRHAYVTSVGIGVYHAMGGKLQRAPHLGRDELARIAPGLDGSYEHALRYTEGQTDDARLTLRVITDGRANGGVARNYCEAVSLLRDRQGQVQGVEIRDGLTGEAALVRARHIVNATGPWSDTVRARAGYAPRQRVVGGSHLVFPRHRLPLRAGMAVYHPDSGLPLYLVPWRGVTIAGTTHVDLDHEVNHPASISSEETGYLLNGVRSLFSDLHLDADDIQATFSGYRPIIDMNTADPARASRDAGVWLEDGLLTVTGGKLTTHRSMARHVLRRIVPRLARWPGIPSGDRQYLASRPGTGGDEVRALVTRKIIALYGPDAGAFFAERGAEELTPLPGLGQTTIAELRWSARHEQVVHLDDLLARRSRIALLAARGGADCLGLIEPIVRQELGWDEGRWQAEVGCYRRSWLKKHGIPGSNQKSEPDLELQQTG